MSRHEIPIRWPKFSSGFGSRLTSRISLGDWILTSGNFAGSEFVRFIYQHFNSVKINSNISQRSNHAEISGCQIWVPWGYPSKGSCPSRVGKIVLYGQFRCLDILHFGTNRAHFGSTGQWPKIWKLKTRLGTRTLEVPIAKNGTWFHQIPTRWRAYMCAVIENCPYDSFLALFDRANAQEAIPVENVSSPHLRRQCTSAISQWSVHAKH